MTYIKDELHMSSSSAATLTQVWSGTCYLTPLLGAFLADAYLGRFTASGGRAAGAGRRHRACKGRKWLRGASLPPPAPASRCSRRLDLPPSHPYTPTQPTWQVILLFSLAFYLVGLVCLTLSASLPGLKPSEGQGAGSSTQGLFWAG